MTTDPGFPTQTRLWLEQWHAGDRSGLDRLLERDLDWVRTRVRHRVGPQLAALGDVDDFVQEAMLEVLEYGPRFVVSDREQFRALVARITENVLRDHLRHARAAKRDVDRAKPIGGETLLELDPPAAREVARPSVVTARNHDRAWIRLAIELLPPADRNLVHRREWEGASFAELAAEFDTTEDSVRMRFNRLLPRLAQHVKALRQGRLPEVLDPSTAGDPEPGDGPDS